MENDRNKGVTEGRFALTLLICMLVAIGYVVLLKLSGSSDSTTIEVVPPTAQAPVVEPDETEPLVLKIDESEPTHMTKRPGEPTSANRAYPVLPAGSTNELQRR